MSIDVAFTTAELSSVLLAAYRLDTPCVACGALPGVFCRAASGRTYSSGFGELLPVHASRRDLAPVRRRRDALERFRAVGSS